MEVPEDWMFTEEQLKTLDSIVATNEYRKDFARIVYYMDITVRSLRQALWSSFNLTNVLSS